MQWRADFMKLPGISRLNQPVTGKRLIEKFDPFSPIPTEPDIQERTRKIPDIAFIHQRHLGILIEDGTQERGAGAKYADDKYWIFV